MESSSLELIEQIRNLTNEPRQRAIAIKDRNFWNQQWSALDILEDTEEAIVAYTKLREHNNLGRAYLEIFGILQVIAVQMETLQNLTIALGYKYEKDPKFTEIKEIRNSATGHPSKRTKKSKERQYNYIIRGSLTNKGFALMTVDISKTFEIAQQQYEISKLINEYKNIFNKKCHEIIKKLTNDAKDHKLKFKGLSITKEVFEGLDFYIEKLNEEIDPHAGAAMSKFGFNSINETYKKFRNELTKRDLDGAYVGVEGQCKELEPALEKLSKHFSGEHQVEKDSLKYLFYFVADTMRKLREMAREIDNEYQFE